MLPCLITCRAGNADGFHSLADSVKFFACSFLKGLVGRLAVDGVNHYLAWRDVLYSLKPRNDISLGGVVYVCTFEEHRLNDRVSVESLYAGNDFVHIISAHGAVNFSYVVLVDSVEFQYVIVDLQQCIAYPIAVDERGIA